MLPIMPILVFCANCQSNDNDIRPVAYFFRNLYCTEQEVGVPLKKKHTCCVEKCSKV